MYCRGNIASFSMRIVNQIVDGQCECHNYFVGFKFYSYLLVHVLHGHSFVGFFFSNCDPLVLHVHMCHFLIKPIIVRIIKMQSSEI